MSLRQQLGHRGVQVAGVPQHRGVEDQAERAELVLLAVAVRLADRSSTTRTRTLREATDHTAALQHAIADLYDTLALQRARLRSVTVRAQQLSPFEDSSVQLTFDRHTELRRRLDPLLDRANARSGADALHFAALLGDPGGHRDVA